MQKRASAASTEAFNGTAEWAYGVTPWFEQGLYLPVYSLCSDERGATINGSKNRELFVRPNAADHEFFYGLKFEFSVNTKLLGIEAHHFGAQTHLRSPSLCWAVADYKGELVNVEAGVGVGVTAGADRLTLKLMISRDLNHRGTPWKLTKCGPS